MVKSITLVRFISPKPSADFLMQRFQCSDCYNWKFCRWCNKLIIIHASWIIYWYIIHTTIKNWFSHRLFYRYTKGCTEWIVWWMVLLRDPTLKTQHFFPSFTMFRYCLRDKSSIKNLKAFLLYRSPIIFTLWDIDFLFLYE